MSISELFGLGLPRGSLMGSSGQKEQVGQAEYDAPAYRNYRLVIHDFISICNR